MAACSYGCVVHAGVTVENNGCDGFKCALCSDVVGHKEVADNTFEMFTVLDEYRGVTPKSYQVAASWWAGRKDCDLATSCAGDEALKGFNGKEYNGCQVGESPNAGSQLVC